MLANPRNCEMVMLCHDGFGRLDLSGRHELELAEKENIGNVASSRVVGYKFHKRLRVLPEKSVRKLKIRMSADER
jgi:hypothetical protein